ncbi:phospholipase A2, membrane associated-like [Centruroides sculpturatus]|uniref:phospholipase A2, membrane associated-like n=1 Tax=Centruroides sculpturatus TaxID=218467 RepID=UPI000C6E4EB1|nr:phospholipase A2, membrane associated-like [Centruroides sculpturatus]
MLSIIKNFALMVLLLSTCHQICEFRSLGRKERSLIDLAEMVKITTGRNGTDFVPYGNWCGMGGSGKAIDPIDDCCRRHDLCYIDKLGKECNSIFNLYVANYKWINAGGKISCSIEDTNPCNRATCACDREVVFCLAKNIKEYKEEHRYVRSALKT